MYGNVVQVWVPVCVKEGRCINVYISPDFRPNQCEYVGDNVYVPRICTSLSCALLLLFVLSIDMLVFLASLWTSRIQMTVSLPATVNGGLQTQNMFPLCIMLARPAPANGIIEVGKHSLHIYLLNLLSLSRFLTFLLRCHAELCLLSFQTVLRNNLLCWRWSN